MSPRTRPLRLVLVHAHPDDETLATGVTAATHARAGVDVTVLTCTLGDEGEIIPGELAHLATDADDALGPYRRGELTAALDALGVSGRVVLDPETGPAAPDAPAAYRDSGMAGTTANFDPRALASAPLPDVVDALAAELARLAPDVVVTYDATGGYGHPDHVRVHQAAVLATARLQPAPALYATVVPRSWAEADRAWVGQHVTPAPDLHVPADDDPYPPSVVPDDAVTHVVTGAPEDLAARDAALAAHRTQVRVRDGWFTLSNDIATRLTTREAFVRVEPGTGRVMPRGGREPLEGLRPVDDVEPAPATDPGAPAGGMVERIGRVDETQAPDIDAALPSSRFRQAMSRFATGVTVVTTSSGGIDHAMTANSVTSVCLDPPMLLVCVEQAARFHDAVTSAGTFAVSIMAAAGEEQAAWFATRGRPDDQFAGIAHERGPHTGAPLLHGALVHLECRVRDVHTGGDHSIVVADVLDAVDLAADLPQIPPALVYYCGQFRSLS